MQGTSARTHDPFGARATWNTSRGPVRIFRLQALEEQGLGKLSRLPYAIRVLLENLLRHVDGQTVTEDDVQALASWQPHPAAAREIAFMPARVILQDFTGVPAVVDLAAMRSAVARMGGDPRRINPLVPADLVIDHSVQVDRFGTIYAFAENVELEYQRNRERYALLRWAQRALDNFRVVPPGTGIVHQVNLEYLASVVQVRRAADGVLEAYPDTLVGTDSHTTMINGLGVLGWGVGGIEAEAVMLGQPYYMLVPEVIGVRLVGRLPEGATATDLVLTVTEMLRRRGVVDKFVEFVGPGVRSLSLPDRATIANMAPEYGATMGFFPVDEETLRYLRGTGRDEAAVQLVERYCKEQGLWRSGDEPEPEYTDLLQLDMGRVEPSLAGPRRPQDRVVLRAVKPSFEKALTELYKKSPAAAPSDGSLRHGDIVIAAITSCTNTSNPSVMVGAALLAKKAVERGLSVKPHVKTSMAPGSRIVTHYLETTGLLPYLEALRFHVIGYGCTTCIGNSGSLPPAVAQQVKEGDLVVAAVLSGNRNFEGRVNPLVRANYLASPMLVVAYALAGRIDIDLTSEPLGTDPNGRPVYLRDIWPSQEEIARTVDAALRPELFRAEYGSVFEGDERWKGLPVPEGELYAWDPGSTYIQEPPFFEEMEGAPAPLRDIEGARALLVLGDSITTDHISPAGAIPRESPAGRYLLEHGVAEHEFNTYGSRRGNHEVMMRGTFANIRLRNLMVPGTEGGVTVHWPDGQRMSVYDAAMRYKEEGVPLVVLAGKEYGTGSSRDWAAKGTYLLGIRAVIAESFERIHRSNLVGMGVLPLQFEPGQNAQSLGLTGEEVFAIRGIAQGLAPRQRLEVTARRADGAEVRFGVTARLDTPVDVEYYRHGGILQAVMRRILGEAQQPAHAQVG
ncbi:MAG: aconitate hydratase AcnA [Limnochordaceae bacterium]|nr:aconitate hydratase AcnA [Limnochordaceae bacterium]